jgi:hypothetical protein
MSEAKAIAIIQVARQMSARMSAEFIVSRRKLAMCGLSEKAIDRICKRFTSGP